MSVDAGSRDKRIAFQRMQAGLDDAGHPTAGVLWQLYCKAWADVFFATGAEQRQAAQETATQAATFEVPYNSKTRALTPMDRVCFPISDPEPANWPAWDISAVDPIGSNEGMRITATRKVA